MQLKVTSNRCWESTKGNGNKYVENGWQGNIGH